MKKFKKLAFILTAAIFVSSCSACGQAKTIAPKPTSSAASAVSSEAESQAASSAAEAAEAPVSGDIYDFQVSVNGISYKLPVAYSEFAKNGWKGQDFDSQKLKPNQMTTEQVSNGSKTIYVTVVNTAKDVLPFSKCNIGGVMLDDFDAKNGAALVLAKGITLGSDYQKIIDTFGKPSNSDDTGSTKVLHYEKDTYSTYELDVDKTTNKLQKIDVQNLVASEGSSSKSAGTADTNVPDVVKNYKAPSSLSSDLYSFQVKYGGALYQLPAPVTEFIKNGWVLQTDASNTVAAQSSGIGVELRKDNQVLRTNVQNYTDKETSVKNCFVTDVMYDENQTLISIELPKGITEKSTFAQVQAAYGKPSKTEDSTSYHYYLYGSIWKQVEIYVTKDTNKIMKIAVEYSPKTLK
ncbi:MAG TPA: hypothetical protein VHP31_07485 [Caproicibacter sp.]|nr:hypothetical protein [Caproicibacter sp.]